MSVLDPEYYGGTTSFSREGSHISRFHCSHAPSPRDEILDVGASDATDDGANVLECNYQYQEKSQHADWAQVAMENLILMTRIKAMAACFADR